MGPLSHSLEWDLGFHGELKCISMHPHLCCPHKGMGIFNSFESLRISLFSTNGRHSVITLSGPSSVVAPQENLAGHRSTALSQGQSYTRGKAITNSACHPRRATCASHAHRQTHTSSMHAFGGTALRSSTTLHIFSLFHLSSPLPLPLCMSFSVTRLSAILHRGELPQY